jgi:hypothetical protein
MGEPHSQSFSGRTRELLQLVEHITRIVAEGSRERVGLCSKGDERLGLRAMLGGEASELVFEVRHGRELTTAPRATSSSPASWPRCEHRSASSRTMAVKRRNSA